MGKSNTEVPDPEDETARRAALKSALPQSRRGLNKGTSGPLQTQRFPQKLSVHHHQVQGCGCQRGPAGGSGTASATPKRLREDLAPGQAGVWEPGTNRSGPLPLVACAIEHEALHLCTGQSLTFAFFGCFQQQPRQLCSGQKKTFGKFAW